MAALFGGFAVILASAVSVAAAAQGGAAGSGGPGSQADPLAPRAGVEAKVSPLAEVTLAVADLDAVARFFGDGLRMACTRARLDGEPATHFRRHHGLAGDGPVELLSCTRPGVPGAARVRAVRLGPEAPAARPGHDARLPGGLSLGFPSAGNAALLERIEGLGFRSSAGLTNITLPRGDGTTYTVGEVHLLAPEGLYALGIDRGEMAPVGPIDHQAGVGGPAYSGAMVTDLEAAARLLGSVVGFEKRREVELESAGPEGGLGLPAGTKFDFQQWFAPGAASGYVILMRLKANARPAVAPGGFAARGLAMWSFEVADDLGLRAQAARAAGVAVRAGPADVPDGTGCRRSLVLDGGDGLLVELVARTASAC
ncbi:MAG: hypothetical protein ACK4MT_06565 [Thermaurantiacus tibetensis]|uniref:hypothetical protein n=1 Tax=Thermaurantiacus tibetensis TaxID=2759035 RepID=UPI00188FB1A5|nr:hypothetical protein [Thermaurantiacus tibetensis]